MQARRDLPELEAVSCSHAYTWQAIELDEQLKLDNRTFQGITQLSIAADPATFNGEETLIAKAWAWQLEVVKNYKKAESVFNKGIGAMIEQESKGRLQSKQKQMGYSW